MCLTVWSPARPRQVTRKSTGGLVTALPTPQLTLRWYRCWSHSVILGRSQPCVPQAVGDKYDGIWKSHWEPHLPLKGRRDASHSTVNFPHPSSLQYHLCISASPPSCVVWRVMSVTFITSLAWDPLCKSSSGRLPLTVFGTYSLEASPNTQTENYHFNTCIYIKQLWSC